MSHETLRYLEGKCPPIAVKEKDEMSPVEDILHSIAWMADNEGNGIKCTARTTIDKILAREVVLAQLITNLKASGGEGAKATGDSRSDVHAPIGRLDARVVSLIDQFSNRILALDGANMDQSEIPLLLGEFSLKLEQLAQPDERAVDAKDRRRYRR